MGQRFFDEEGLHVPQHLWFTDKERRHKSEKREDFQRVLSLVENGALDWIAIATFDRWGVKDIDEFWRLRLQLKDGGVRLWSIQDRLDLISVEQGDCWHIFAKAVACTMQMEVYAEKNIMKMVERALEGWHLSGNHPYGTDLVCCRLSDKLPLFRVHQLSKNPHNVGKRTYRIYYYNEEGKVEREETVTKMPPRDCKENGYRLAPSIDESRIDDVRVIHELYDSGLENGQIAKALLARGRRYFGKNWGWNTIASILCNPAYIGRPAWGKIAVGQYKHVINGKAERPRQRSKDEPITFDKGDKHYIYPREPVFAPCTFMPVDLFERAERRHKSRERRNGHRSRNKARHPLNGLLVCPDCMKPMDISGSQSKGDTRIMYFICSTYVKTRRNECRANSVQWKYLDAASEQVMERVKGELAELSALSTEQLSSDGLLKLMVEHSANFRLIGKLFCEMLEETGRDSFECPVDIFEAPVEMIREHKAEIGAAFKVVYDDYLRKHEISDAKRRGRIAEIEGELDTLADLAKEAPTERQRKRFWSESSELDEEIKRLEQGSASLFDKLASILDHGKALARTIEEMEAVKDAELWRVFVERIVPVFKRRDCKDGIQRSYVEAFQFEPKESATDVLPAVMEIPHTRKGKDLTRQSR